MSSPPITEDLLDLKLLPAWVNEPVRPNDYANYEGEDSRFEEHGDRRPPQRRREGNRRGPPSRESRGPQSRESRGPQSREQRSRRPRSDRPGPARRDENHRGRDDR